MKQGIISLGEALIDFIPTDDTNTTYLKSPGGAPANVAVGLARLGARSSFSGKIGDDSLGRFLEETLVHYGVETKQLKFTAEVKTGITHVTNAPDGERSFEFFINPSADRFLEIQDIDEDDFKSHKIFHFGSISMIDNPIKATTRHAVKLPKENNMIVSYDPNLRLALWESSEKARDTIISMLKWTDVLKVSDEELEFITGKKTIDEGVNALAKYEIPFMIVTLGANGCYVYIAEGYSHVQAMKVEAVDTTGAGDAFVSGILYSINNYEGDIHNISLHEAIKMAEFASVSGALAASTKGAMTALPALAEVEQYLAVK